MFYKQLKFKRLKDETFNNRHWSTDSVVHSKYLASGRNEKGLK